MKAEETGDSSGRATAQEGRQRRKGDSAGRATAQEGRQARAAELDLSSRQRNANCRA
jgi:hypothetical protein